MKTKFASIAKRLVKYPCGLLASSDGLLKFRYNDVKYSEDAISFSKANSFDSLSFNWDYIKSLDVDQMDQGTIRIETSDGRKYSIIDIQPSAILHNRKAETLDFEDVSVMAHRCIAATLLYQDQGIFSRTEFTSITVNDDSEEILFGGQAIRDVKEDETIIEFGDENNFVKLILSPESEYILTEQTNDRAVIHLHQVEQPFAHIMLIMYFAKYEMLIPSDKLFVEDIGEVVNDEK